jgi:uncharacterized protein YigA (DUF484 family)
MVQTKDLPGSPEDIIEYLRSHPDFFVEHTDILSELNIPHDTPGQLASTGNVASLIEHQVAQLRHENSSLNENLEKSEEDVAQQRKLAKATHDLSLQLMKVDSFEALNDLLSKNLRQHYQAEHFLFLVFKTPVYSEDCSDIRFLEANSKLAFMFTELFHHNKPLCDSLQIEHIDALFGSKGEVASIRSTALIPVQQSDWHGLLVLGSKKQDQYCHGFEMDLLNYITMISAALIENIVSSGHKTNQGEIPSSQ